MNIRKGLGILLLVVLLGPSCARVETDSTVRAWCRAYDAMQRDVDRVAPVGSSPPDQATIARVAATERRFLPQLTRHAPSQAVRAALEVLSANDSDRDSVDGHDADDVPAAYEVLDRYAQHYC
jgi:hypothetical protein